MSEFCRAINQETGQPLLSGDELSRDDCNAVAGWIREQITGEEHPQLLASLEWAADWFDYSAEDLGLNCEKKKDPQGMLWLAKETYTNLSPSEKIKFGAWYIEHGFYKDKCRAIII